ncbi:MAG: methyltransferase domain-containing protein, partial [Moraxellaceae bacterium]
MNLIDEYIKQQAWRNWPQYISKIPLSKNDHAVDLGCSVGGISHLLSEEVARVTGIDLNQDFINYCNASKKKTRTLYVVTSLKWITPHLSLLPVSGAALPA